MYIMYGKTNCPQCEAAKRFLVSRGLDYEYKQFGIDYDLDDLMALPNVSRAMPQVFLSESGVITKHIGSTQELINHVEGKQ